MLRPPSIPQLPALLPGQRAGGDTAPRTPSPVRSWRRTVMVAARVGNNLNQLARWANTHAAVIAHLVSFERSLLAAMARFDGDGGDAH